MKAPHAIVSAVLLWWLVEQVTGIQISLPWWALLVLAGVYGWALSQVWRPGLEAQN